MMLRTSSTLLHCKNKRIGLTQLGLPEFHYQYQRMCTQGDQLHCLAVIGSKQFHYQYQRMCMQEDQLHCLTVIGSKQLSYVTYDRWLH